MNYSEFLSRLNGNLASAWMREKRYGMTWQEFAGQHGIVDTLPELELRPASAEVLRRQEKSRQFYSPDRDGDSDTHGDLAPV